MKTSGIFSKTSENTVLFAAFVAGSAALIAGKKGVMWAGNKAYNMTAHCGNRMMSAGNWVGTTFMDGVHFTLKDGGITGPISAGILSGTAIGLTYKYSAIPTNRQPFIENPGHEIGNRPIVMMTSVFALTALAIRYSNSKFNSHQISLGGALSYAVIATIASLFTVSVKNDPRDYEFLDYPKREPTEYQAKRLAFFIENPLNGHQTLEILNALVEEPNVYAEDVARIFQQLSKETQTRVRNDLSERIKEKLPQQHNFEDDGFMHLPRGGEHFGLSSTHGDALTWKESAKMGIYAGLASGIATAVAYFGIKSIYAFGEAFPMIKGSIPAAMIVAPTFVLAENKFNKKNEEKQRLYSMLIAAAAGTLLTPILSSFILKKKVGYQVSALYSLSSIIGTLFLLKVKPVNNRSRSEEMQEFPLFRRERGLMMARPVISNALFDDDFLGTHNDGRRDSPLLLPSVYRPRRTSGSSSSSSSVNCDDVVGYEDAVPLLKSDRQYDGRPMGSQDFRSQHEYMGSQDFHSPNSPDDSYQ